MLTIHLECSQSDLSQGPLLCVLSKCLSPTCFLCVTPVFFNPATHHQIERTLFEDTVKTLNNYYAEAEKIGGQSYLEGCLACVTAYLIFLCMETRYEKVRLV